jgi:hypothetical protein
MLYPLSSAFSLCHSFLFPYTNEASKMSEKEQTIQVSEPSQPGMDSNDRETRSEESPSEEKPTEEKPSETAKTGIDDKNEPVPHLHAKTYLTVFAVCLIYFAQLINVVGAGAVSFIYLLLEKH